MWVLSKEVLIAYNVLHLKVIFWHLLLVKNKGSSILMFILSFDTIEIYKWQVYMYVINVHQFWALIFFINTINVSL